MQSSQFRKLQKKWYKKLKDEGFKDLEYNETLLVTYDGSRFCPSRTGGLSPTELLTSVSMKTRYYRLAGYFLYDHKFTDPLERQIWEEHSQGVSYRNIVKKLAKLGIKTTKQKINTIILDLKQKMLERYKDFDNE